MVLDRWYICAWRFFNTENRQRRVYFSQRQNYVGAHILRTGISRRSQTEYTAIVCGIEQILFNMLESGMFGLFYENGTYKSLNTREQSKSPGISDFQREPIASRGTTMRFHPNSG